MTGSRAAARALLAWYLDAGVDEAIGAEPVDRFAAAAKPAAVPVPSGGGPTTKPMATWLSSRWYRNEPP